MNFRNELARIIARDPRFSIEAYAFVIEALQHARRVKLRKAGRDRESRRQGPTVGRPKTRKAEREAGHVTGRELCETVRKLALKQYGRLAAMVLGHWGVHTTSDLGDIVFNLIAAGDLEKTASDSRADFDGVFEFSVELGPGAS